MARPSAEIAPIIEAGSHGGPRRGPAAGSSRLQSAISSSPGPEPGGSPAVTIVAPPGATSTGYPGAVRIRPGLAGAPGPGTSQSRVRPSLVPVASARPSPDSTTGGRTSDCPASGCPRGTGPAGGAGSQSMTVPSPLVVVTVVPSAENTTASTYSGWPGAG
jgi:hypothetical protein